MCTEKWSHVQSTKKQCSVQITQSHYFHNAFNHSRFHKIVVKSKAKETVYAVTFVVGIFIIVSIFFVNSLQSGTPVGTTIPTISCPDGFTESRQCIFTSQGDFVQPVCVDNTDPNNVLTCGEFIDPLGANVASNFIRCSGVPLEACVP